MELAQGPEHRGREDAAGSQARPHRQIHVRTDIETGERFAGADKFPQAQSGPVNCERIARADGRQNLLGRVKLGRGTIGGHANQWNVQWRDPRLDGVASVDFDCGIQHRSSPVDAERRCVGPPASQIDAGGSGNRKSGCAGTVPVQFRNLGTSPDTLGDRRGDRFESSFPGAGGFGFHARLGQQQRGLPIQARGLLRVGRVEQVVASPCERDDARSVSQQRTNVGAGLRQRTGQPLPFGVPAGVVGFGESFLIGPLGRRLHRKEGARVRPPVGQKRMFPGFIGGGAQGESLVFPERPAAFGRLSRAGLDGINLEHDAAETARSDNRNLVDHGIFGRLERTGVTCEPVQNRSPPGAHGNLKLTLDGDRSRRQDAPGRQNRVDDHPRRSDTRGSRRAQALAGGVEREEAGIPGQDAPERFRRAEVNELSFHHRTVKGSILQNRRQIAMDPPVRRPGDPLSGQSLHELLIKVDDRGFGGQNNGGQACDDIRREIEQSAVHGNPSVVGQRAGSPHLGGRGFLQNRIHPALVAYHVDAVPAADLGRGGDRHAGDALPPPDHPGRIKVEKHVAGRDQHARGQIGHPGGRKRQDLVEYGRDLAPRSFHRQGGEQLAAMSVLRQPPRLAPGMNQKQALGFPIAVRAATLRACGEHAGLRRPSRFVSRRDPARPGSARWGESGRTRGGAGSRNRKPAPGSHCRP